MKFEKYSGGCNVCFTGKWADSIGFRTVITFALPIIAGLFVLITHVFYRGIACPIHECLGIYCFLCGVTRSSWAVLEGRFVDAYNFNPMFFILLPYLLLKYCEMGAFFIKTKKLRLTWDVLFLFIAAVVYMVWRNLWGFLQPLPVEAIFN